MKDWKHWHLPRAIIIEMSWTCHPNEILQNFKNPYLYPATWEKEKCWTTISQLQGQPKNNFIARRIPVDIFEQVASIRKVWRVKLYKTSENLTENIFSISKHGGRRRKLHRSCQLFHLITFVHGLSTDLHAKVWGWFELLWDTGMKTDESLYAEKVWSVHYIYIWKS